MSDTQVQATGAFWSDALDFQTRALQLRSQRQQVIASNIANADTPGYRARDFDFAASLRDAVAQGSSATSTDARVPTATSPLHMTSTGAAAGSADPGLVDTTNAQASQDRNTVDLDRERGAFAENSVKYEATLRFVNAGVRNMLDAMRSPSSG